VEKRVTKSTNQDEDAIAIGLMCVHVRQSYRVKPAKCKMSEDLYNVEFRGLQMTLEEMSRALNANEVEEEEMSVPSKSTQRLSHLGSLFNRTQKHLHLYVCG